MRLQATFLLLAAGAALAIAPSRAYATDGEDLTVINKTGHTVGVAVLQNDSPSLDPDDGVQAGTIKDGKSAVAHVPNCKFGIILWDKEDVWHAEFHDCKTTSITFTAETGHGKREYHKH